MLCAAFVVSKGKPPVAVKQVPPFGKYLWEITLIKRRKGWDAGNVETLMCRFAGGAIPMSWPFVWNERSIKTRKRLVSIVVVFGIVLTLFLPMLTMRKQWHGLWRTRSPPAPAMPHSALTAPVPGSKSWPSYTGHMENNCIQRANKKYRPPQAICPQEKTLFLKGEKRANER